MSKPLQTKRVLLLKPRSFAFSSSPPLNLMSLAAFLRARGYASRILDMGFPEDVADLQALGNAAPPVLFGVTATPPEFPEAIRLVRGLKARFPDVPVVIGGIHVSALGVDAVSEAGADLGVCGEGEETLAELVGALDEDGPGADLSGILGLIIRDDTGVRMNHARPVMRDIDALPPPAWDLNPGRAVLRQALALPAAADALGVRDDIAGVSLWLHILRVAHHPRAGLPRPQSRGRGGRDRGSVPHLRGPGVPVR